MKYYVSVWIRNHWLFINTFIANSDAEAIKMAKKSQPNINSGYWKAELDWELD